MPARREPRPPSGLALPTQASESQSSGLRPTRAKSKRHNLNHWEGKAPAKTHWEGEAPAKTRWEGEAPAKTRWEGEAPAEPLGEQVVHFRVALVVADSTRVVRDADASPGARTLDPAAQPPATVHDCRVAGLYYIATWSEGVFNRLTASDSRHPLHTIAGLMGVTEPEPGGNRNPCS